MDKEPRMGTYASSTGELVNVNELNQSERVTAWLLDLLHELDIAAAGDIYHYEEARFARRMNER